LSIPPDIFPTHGHRTLPQTTLIDRGQIHGRWAWCPRKPPPLHRGVTRGERGPAVPRSLPLGTPTLPFARAHALLSGASMVYDEWRFLIDSMQDGHRFSHFSLVWGFSFSRITSRPSCIHALAMSYGSSRCLYRGMDARLSQLQEKGSVCIKESNFV
jgi:hypothetical protein